MKGLFLVIAILTTFSPAEMSVIDTAENLVSVVDNNGNIWKFEDEGFSVGDNVMVIMNNKGTDTIYDDEIVAVKKVY